MPARSPQQLDDLFAEAISRGELDAVLALYEPGAVLPNQAGELRTGTDAIRQELAPLAAMKPDMKTRTTKVIETGDIAVVYTQWSMTTPAQMSGRAVEVSRRQPDGTWLLVIDDPFTLGPA